LSAVAQPPPSATGQRGPGNIHAGAVA
jgi:hypothetical protein